MRTEAPVGHTEPSQSPCLQGISTATLQRSELRSGMRSERVANARARGTVETQTPAGQAFAMSPQERSGLAGVAGAHFCAPRTHPSSSYRGWGRERGSANGCGRSPHFMTLVRGEASAVLQEDQRRHLSGLREMVNLSPSVSGTCVPLRAELLSR